MKNITFMNDARVSGVSVEANAGTNLNSLVESAVGAAVKAAVGR
jgi:hypothetical protein